MSAFESRWHESVDPNAGSEAGERLRVRIALHILALRLPYESDGHGSNVGGEEPRNGVHVASDPFGDASETEPPVTGV